MVRAIKEYVVVGEGGLIEIRRPELPAGSAAEVIVMVDDGLSPAPPLASLIGKASSGYTSGEEADAFIRRERDAWER
jgi:hypothetical protein